MCGGGKDGGEGERGRPRFKMNSEKILKIKINSLHKWVCSEFITETFLLL